MGYLFDSDIVIDFFKDKDYTRSIFELVGDASKFMSVVVFGELLVGAVKSITPNKKRRELFNFLKTNKVKLLPITRKVAEEYVSIRVDLERKGQKLPGLDLLIAATALSQNLVLVTGNKKHFQRIKNLKLL